MRAQRAALPVAVTVGTNVAADLVGALRHGFAGIRDPAREYRKVLRRYERAVSRLRTAVFVGSVGAVATAVAAVAGRQPWWLVLTAISCWVGGRAFVGLRRARPPEPPPAWLPASPGVAVTPLPRLRSGAAGAVETERLGRAESSLRRVLPAVADLHPSAAAELRDAAAECGPVLHQQAGRLAVLAGIEADLPGSAAAQSAASAAREVADRLGHGVDAYERLLAAAAELLAAPDLSRSAEATVAPAIQGMHAYAHGLTRASDSDAS
jgi:hypothetical protein